MIRYQFRQRPKSDVWHFHENCRWWPTLSFDAGIIVQIKKPTTGEFCNECLAKERKDLKR